jgi:S1-C subfamily serine protease
MRFRIALLLVALVAAALAARLAFAAASATPIGNGVVVIDTTLGYQEARAAGTGMVLTSNGEVLTNNHVIAGSTTLTVVVPGTSHRYSATVAGYDVTADVAVLKLKNASNLKTVTASTAAAALGQRVRALGNAGGTGTLTSATGRITGVGKSITASDGETSERLTGLLETNANVQAGDSGGPLLDVAGGVLGMDTAASRGGFGYGFDETAATPDAYAIPIAHALSIAHQIESGRSSATIHIGGTAFLGVQVESMNGNAVIAAVVPGGPAARAGLTAGDTIRAIDGRQVNAAGVRTYLLTKKPGTTVTVSYVSEAGSQGSVRVTLASGPPQ